MQRQTRPVRRVPRAASTLTKTERYHCTNKTKRLSNSYAQKRNKQCQNAFLALLKYHFKFADLIYHFFIRRLSGGPPAVAFGFCRNRSGKAIRFDLLITCRKSIWPYKHKTISAEGKCQCGEYPVRPVPAQTRNDTIVPAKQNACQIHMHKYAHKQSIARTSVHLLPLLLIFETAHMLT